MVMAFFRSFSFATSLLILLLSLSQHALSGELFDFSCSINPLDTDPISCQNPITKQQIPNNLVNLVRDLARSRYLDSSSGHCEVGTLGTRCDYLLGDNIIALDCEQLVGSAATVCKSTDLADAVRIGCDFTLNDGNRFGCQFEFRKDDLINKMVNDIGQMNTNHSSISKTMVACISNSDMDTQMNWMCENIVKRILNGTDNERREAGEMLRIMTPAKTDASMDVSHTATSTGINDIRQRLGNLRSGLVSNHSVQIHYFDGNAWHSAGTQLAQASNTASDASAAAIADKNISEYGRWGLFINGSFINSEQTTSDIESGHEADTQTLTLGFDYRFNNQFIGGLAANLSQSETDYSLDAGSLDNDNTTIILYSSLYFTDWFFDSSLSYGTDSYEQKRNVSCQSCYFQNLSDPSSTTKLDQTYSSDFDGSQIALSISTGYTWNLNAWNITPSLQYSFATLKTDDYTETASDPDGNGASMALAISDQERDISTLKAAINLNHVISIQKGVFIPSINVQLVEELEDDSQVVTGNFIGNIKTNNTSFHLATNEVDTSYFIMGAGFSFQLRNGNAGFINIQSTEAYEDIKQIQYTAGWRWEL